MGAEKMYLAGEWTDSENGEVSDAINPTTGEVLATVPKATMNDVNRCVDASRAAFNSRMEKYRPCTTRANTEQDGCCNLRCSKGSGED